MASSKRLHRTLSAGGDHVTCVSGFFETGATLRYQITASHAPCDMSLSCLQYIRPCITIRPTGESNVEINRRNTDQDDSSRKAAFRISVGGTACLNFGVGVSSTGRLRTRSDSVVSLVLESDVPMTASAGSCGEFNVTPMNCGLKYADPVGGGSSCGAANNAPRVVSGQPVEVVKGNLYGNSNIKQGDHNDYCHELQEQLFSDSRGSVW